MKFMNTKCHHRSLHQKSTALVHSSNDDNPFVGHYDGPALFFQPQYHILNIRFCEHNAVQSHGGSMFLLNAVNHLPNYAASHPEDQGLNISQILQTAVIFHVLTHLSQVLTDNREAQYARKTLKKIKTGYLTQIIHIINVIFFLNT